MEPRIKFYNVATGPLTAMLSLESEIRKGGLEPKLLDMVRLRVSQINGCAYCIDMHWKDARAAGESEQRLYGLGAWEEAPYYTARERAALAWAEAVTNLGEGHVPDVVFDAAKAQFNEKELVTLTWAIAAINGWNRVAIALRAAAGEYKPKTHSA
jgi:AhpD family alkylhydroperoxidase